MCSPPPAGKEIKFDGLTLSTCHSIINLMDVSLLAHVCACTWRLLRILSWPCWLGALVLPLTTNQVDNTGMLEFQEFKVFWEKMKKWIVRFRFWCSATSSTQP